MSTATASETRHPLRRLLTHARAHRPRVFLACACSVLNKLFDLAPPALIGAAVDVVVEREDSLIASFGVVDLTAQLWVLAIATILIWGLESLFEFFSSMLWRNLAQTIQHELRLDAYAHLQQLELAWFEDQRAGDLMSILGDDVNQLERFLDSGAADIIMVGTTALVVGSVFFAVAPTVAYLAMAPIPVIVVGSFVFQDRIAPRYRAVRDRAGAVNARLAANMGGMAAIKSCVAEDHELARLERVSSDYREANRHAIALSSAFSPLIRMAIVCGFGATLVVGGKMALDGSLAVGAYGLLVFLTQRLLWPLTRLGSTVDLYQRAMASTRRILDLLAVPPQSPGGGRPLPDAQAGRTIRFEQVRFAYADGRVVFEQLDLAIPAGQTTAIVGATGAGKSTLIKLLLRFYDVDGGRVTVDELDVRELALTDLRAQLGYVPQEPFLFYGSVADNVRYRRPDATDEQVQAACRIAEADAFVRELPDGYDTLIGERGQKLSGGQQQRLMIARAVLGEPPVLVLDEATSAVDNETEAAIQRSLARIAVGRTTLVVAHRLSTVRRAHCIHVLDGGRVAESGTHEQLLALGGRYAHLWRVQTGETLPV